MSVRCSFRRSIERDPHGRKPEMSELPTTGTGQALGLHCSISKGWRFANEMLCGDPGLLAIESEITQAFEDLSLRALGYFVIHVRGHKYGVKSPEATMLANSFDEVTRRIAMRGHHSAEFATDSGAGQMASAYIIAEYEDATPHDDFLGLRATDFRPRVKTGKLVWAPDGDEAFDDGSHILQFDVRDRVRLIAFRRDYGSRGATTELQDVWLDSSHFYEVLKNWHDGFLNEWRAMLKPRF